MKDISGDSAREAYPLYREEGSGSIPTSPLQLFFSSISESVFVQLNAAWHSRLPKVGHSHFRVCYGAEYQSD